MTDQLQSALTERIRLVVIGEAQNLNRGPDHPYAFPLLMSVTVPYASLYD